jgi:hypothetical protein
MTLYCYTQNGLIVDGPKPIPTSWRNISGLHLASPERLKELGWLLVVEDQSGFDAGIHDHTGWTHTVGDGDVTAIRQYVTKPAPTADYVRAEARRRIIAVYPGWAQANMTARAVELVKTLSTGTLTADEQTELAALEGAWAWIKSVRASSNTLEVMSPIPADYTADQRWPRIS